MFAFLENLISKISVISKNLQNTYNICKNVQDIQSRIYIMTFNGRNKFVYRLHFFSQVHKNIKSYKHPLSIIIYKTHCIFFWELYISTFIRSI